MRFDEKRNFRDASCCKVLVVNGANALRDVFFFSIFTTDAETTGSPKVFNISSISSLLLMVCLSIFLFLYFDKIPLNSEL